MWSFLVFILTTSEFPGKYVICIKNHLGFNSLDLFASLFWYFDVYLLLPLKHPFITSWRPTKLSSSLLPGISRPLTVIFRQIFYAPFSSSVFASLHARSCFPGCLSYDSQGTKVAILQAKARHQKPATNIEAEYLEVVPLNWQIWTELLNVLCRHFSVC